MTYREGAEKYYDLFGAKYDAPFYIDLAIRHGRRALELGIGTARLAIQLARAGVETWGIDNSPHMIRAALANLSKEQPEVRQLVHLEKADVRNFDLGEQFGLIYFPSFSFDHLLTHEDQASALRCIRKHATQASVYAFDLSNVVEKERGWFVQRKPLDNKRTVVRLGFHRMCPEKRQISVDIWYELYEEGRMVERYHEGGEVYSHSPESIKQLLEENGFGIEAIFGGYDRRPFTGDSEMMVIIARPI
jgi:SAM-dependent methyltransferase